MPTIKTSASDTSKVKVSYVCKDTGYATLVFVDMRDTKNASTDDASSASDEFVFIMNEDSHGNDAKDNEVYTYNAIVDGKETTINLDAAVVNGEYTLYTSIRKNSDGYVKTESLREVGIDKVSDKYVTSDLAVATVDYSDGVLTVGGKDWTVVNDTKIYLVTTDTDLISNNGDDYEADCQISASTLKSTLKGYLVSGTAYAIKTDSDSDTTSLSALYIFVNNAVEKTVKSIAVKTAPSTTTYMAGQMFNPAGLVITVTYTTGTPEDVTYAGNAAAFTFTPATTAALKTTDTSVTIGYGGQTVAQTITVS
jgi:predicted nucleic acid-binding Zn ribbon protein